VSAASTGERPLAPRAPSAPPEAPLDGPSLDFRAATALLGSGDNVAAAAAFAGFLAKYPRDPRGEDASYLRIIALQRAGDSGGTERAAAEYLRRYPKGFRRAEVEKLAP
jgi:TolA-binding protein